MVLSAGFEPATYPLGGDCSIQLSYESVKLLKFLEGKATLAKCQSDVQSMTTP